MTDQLPLPVPRLRVGDPGCCSAGHRARIGYGCPILDGSGRFFQTCHSEGALAPEQTQGSAARVRRVRPAYSVASGLSSGLVLEL